MAKSASKDVSLSERESLVRQAFYKAFPDNGDDWLSCIAVYDDYLIASGRSAEYWRVEFTIDEAGAYAFTPRPDWARVEQSWITKAGLGVFVAFGGTVKALGGGKFRAPLVQFGGDGDLTPYRDTFTKSTDFGIEDDEWGSVDATVLWHHGQDPIIGKRAIGKAKLSKDDSAVWMDGYLNLRDDYERAIYGMIEAGKVGTSSGALSHLVERKALDSGAHEITMWRGIREDASLTPTPADYRNVVIPVKTFQSMSLPDLKAYMPQATHEAAEAASAAAHKAADRPSIEFINNGETPVPEETKNEEKAKPFDAEGAFTDLSAKFTRFMELIENSPVIKSAGFITQDGGSVDKNIKSFADFIIAVKRGDMKRIETVYETKAVYEDSGVSAGILIPRAYATDVLQMRDKASEILPLIRRMPVSVDSGSYPALDQAGVTPDGDGQTAYAGGLAFSWTDEGGTIDETELAFEQIEWKIHKLAGKTFLSNEVMADAPMLEGIIRQNVGLALANREEAAILRGNGVGKPLGFYHSPAKIDISPDSNGVFAFADALEMWTRFRAQNDNAVRWVMHKSVMQDLGAMVIGSSDVTFLSRLQDNPRYPLLGYPIAWSQHLPTRTNSGDVMLVDFSVYQMFDRQQPAIAFSEHFKFDTDQVTFRVTERLDGAPWLSGAITDASPTGSFTESPIVNFND